MKTITQKDIFLAEKKLKELKNSLKVSQKRNQDSLHKILGKVFVEVIKKQTQNNPNFSIETGKTLTVKDTNFLLKNAPDLAQVFKKDGVILGASDEAHEDNH